ncbi:hypothetical protein A2U01_0092797, partial [Trifolium medium]|nr:hypothetical protein [Trifolium medium]
AEDEVRSVEEEFSIPSQDGKADVTPPDLVTDHIVRSADNVSGIKVQGSPSICSLAGGFRSPSGTGGLEGSAPVPCRSTRT